MSKIEKQTSVAAWRSVDDKVVERMKKWRGKQWVERSQLGYLPPPGALQRFVSEFALYQDFGPREPSVAKAYIVARAAKLPADVREWLESQCASRLSVYEITERLSADALQLRDMLKPGSAAVTVDIGLHGRHIERGERVLCRVVAHRGLSLVCALHPTTVDAAMAQRIVDYVLKSQGANTAELPSLLQTVEFQAALLFWWDKLNDMARYGVLPENDDNTTWHESVMEGHAFAASQRSKIIQRLMSLDGMTLREPLPDVAILKWTSPRDGVGVTTVTVDQEELVIEGDSKKTRLNAEPVILEALRDLLSAPSASALHAD